MEIKEYEINDIRKRYGDEIVRQCRAGLTKEGELKNLAVLVKEFLSLFKDIHDLKGQLELDSVFNLKEDIRFILANLSESLTHKLGTPISSRSENLADKAEILTELKQNIDSILTAYKQVGNIAILLRKLSAREETALNSEDKKFLNMLIGLIKSESSLIIPKYTKDLQNIDKKYLKNLRSLHEKNVEGLDKNIEFLLDVIKRLDKPKYTYFFAAEKQVFNLESVNQEHLQNVVTQLVTLLNNLTSKSDLRNPLTDLIYSISEKMHKLQKKEESPQASCSQIYFEMIEKLNEVRKQLKKDEKLLVEKLLRLELGLLPELYSVTNKKFACLDHIDLAIKKLKSDYDLFQQYKIQQLK